VGIYGYMYIKNQIYIFIFSEFCVLPGKCFTVRTLGVTVTGHP
jgi:hypothetical protein